MIILMLAASAEDATRSTARPESILVLRPDTDLRTFVIPRGQPVRIVRADRWPHDDRVVALLRRHQGEHGNLVDPTGLLGRDPSLPVGAVVDKPPIGGILSSRGRRGGRPRSIQTDI